MDSSPALYMCFRCYQLFDSLDDVLFHQYDLHPNDLGDEGSLTLAPGPQTESDELFQCVPCWVLFSSQEELTQHRRSSGCSQHEPSPDGTAATQPASGPTQQSPAAAEQDRWRTPRAPSGPEQPAQTGLGTGGPGSASLIQFQCGDCGRLFESLGPWLQHRKLNECRATAAPEPAGEVPNENRGAGPTEGGVTEAPPPDAEAEKEPTDSRGAQEGGAGDGEENGGDRPRAAGGRRRKSATPAAAAATPCRSFLCGECGAGFNWQPALVAHRRTEHSLEGALHHCLECGESFMNTALFVQHCKKHRDWLARKPRAKRKRSLQQRVENGGREKEIIRKRPTKRRLKEKAPTSALEPGSEAAAAAAAAAADRLPPARKPRRRRGAPLECPQCRRTFSNPRYLRAHVLGHSGQKQFRCETCDKRFTYQNNLRRHRLLHTGDRPYMCDRCGKTFTQSSHLKDHLRNHERGLGWARPRGRGARDHEWADVGPKLPHPCPDCPRSFMARAQLLMHRKMCPICERSFKWRGSLPAHIVRHTDSKLFSCDVCGKTFSYQTNLARHLIIHTGTRPYACRHCGKTFNQSSNLRQHLLVHAKAGARRRAADGDDGAEAGAEGGEPEAQLLHACPDCPVSFKTFAQLQKHRLGHAGQDSFLCSVCGLEPCSCQQPGDQCSASQPDAEAESLSCPRCSAAFDSQAALEGHAPGCAGDAGGRGPGGQAECELCGRCCASPEELELHQLSHVGQAQRQCPLAPCQRRFATSAALQNHLFSHFPGPTCQNPRPEGLLDPTAPPHQEETEVETTVAEMPSASA
ncbi:zinc finger protein 497-like [Anguilla anguilla]|uniref:zinc finger protein 497-like n=1 Tax=Anguilla anguilla TaxID=7936 RepID=UPI0015AFC161|nr:zinc finger protein 497-like [Anguilla anguilla]